MSIRDLWNRVHEPRVEKFVYFIIYAGTAIFATLTALSPPITIADPLGPILTIVWVGLWILSALIGAGTVFSGWWAFERIGLWLGILGVAIYTVVVFALHFTTGGSRLAQLTALWIAAGFYIARLVSIWGRDFEPRN